MKKKALFIGVLILAGILVLSGCGKQETSIPTDIPVASPGESGVSWLAEPMQVSEGDFTVELLSVVRDGTDFHVTIKFPLPDWRTWYVARIGLDVGHVYSFNDAGANIIERLYQKGPNTYCLQKASDFYEEKCISSTTIQPYETVDLVFYNVPEVDDGTQVDIILLALSTATRSGKFCEDLPLTYIQETVVQSYPGLTLECTGDDVRIAADSGYADDSKALAAVDDLVEFAGEGEITGRYEFEFLKQSQ